MTAARVANDLVPDSINRIAGVHNRLVNGWQHTGGNVARLARVDRLVSPKELRIEVRTGVTRVAGHDAIVIGGKPLRLRERLTATGRTPDEVRPLRKSAMVAPDNQLRGNSGHVECPVAPIDDFFRMLVRELQIATGVSGVTSGRGVATSECVGHCRVADLTGIATVPDTLPFQSRAGGIQTSKLMIESLDGLATPITRQNAGTENCEVAVPPGLNIPAGTSRAEVIVTSVIESFIRAAQDGAAHAAGRAAMAINRRRSLISQVSIIYDLQLGVFRGEAVAGDGGRWASSCRVRASYHVRSNWTRVAYGTKSR